MIIHKYLSQLLFLLIGLNVLPLCAQQVGSGLPGTIVVVIDSLELPADSLAPPADVLHGPKVVPFPVYTKAMKDSVAQYTKMAHRLSTDARNPDFKASRRYVTRLLALADSLRLPMATHLVVAGDVEHQAFNYERNKPALGKKTDEKECLAAAKRCFLYYRQAYELYQASPQIYRKEATKNCRRIQPLAMQYYLLTKGFLVNAGQSYAKNDLATTLEEFLISYDGSTQPFLLEQYQSDPKHQSDFETYLADSTRFKTLYNCGTVAMALNRYDSALTFFDTLKVHRYELDKVYRNTLSIYYALNDTARMMQELRTAIRLMPQNTWFMKNLLQIHIDRQEWTQAGKLAADITALDSLDAQVICMKGQLYEHQGKTQQAIDIYMQSYALDSTQANVCSFIGRIYYNRGVQLKAKLFDQKRTQLTEAKLLPLYDQAQPWYERAYALDVDRRDQTIALALREMLYYRFTRLDCTNSGELIDFYNEVSRAYGMAEFGQ